MVSGKQFSTRITALLCAFLLALPVASQAASDEDLAAMRAQLQALSERLDRLESENRELAATNAKLLKENQETTLAVAHVNEKTETVAVAIQEQVTKTDWTDRIRWKGDFRYRYENFDIEDTPDRNRNRIRARAALLANVTPDVEVGFGLASGSDDPLSTNQTLGGGGSSKGLNLDLAYIDWSGLTNTHVLGGKFSNYLHKSGSNALLWDGDWRPEGMGVRWDNGTFFANGLGTWIESDSKNDQSFAYGVQSGVSLPITDELKLTAGIGYYEFDSKGSSSFFGDDDDFFGNSFDPVTNTYLHDYEEVEVFADLAFRLFDQPVTVFADFVQNQAADKYDTGYAFGFTFGKAKDRGQWEFGYVYQELEADAVLGLLTDSDFGGGGTDSRGHKLNGSYAIAKNFNTQFTYLISEVGLQSGDPYDHQVLQLNLSLKY